MDDSRSLPSRLCCDTTEWNEVSGTRARKTLLSLPISVKSPGSFNSATNNKYVQKSLLKHFASLPDTREIKARSTDIISFVTSSSPDVPDVESIRNALYAQVSLDLQSYVISIPMIKLRRAIVNFF